MALQTGRPFSRLITVHWSLAGIQDHDAAAATGRLIKLMGDRARSRGWSLEWTYSRENNDDDGKGSHVHILAHVPPDEARAFAARQRGWLKRITGRTYQPRSVHSRPIGPSTTTYLNAPAVYSANLEVAVAYLTKGALPQVAAEIGLSRVRDGGRILGKRAGWSQSLGRAAKHGEERTLLPSPPSGASTRRPT